ncbi:MAG: BLUF domain-containing protein [Gemmatimonadaceae bacterium]
MTSPVVFLAYASSATRRFAQEELLGLLAVSRTNNERSNLTGMLLYRGGNFLQALEGPEHEIRDTMKRIDRDLRHGSIVHLYEERQNERVFGNWTMGFKDVATLNPAEHPGLNYYLSRAGHDHVVSANSDHDVFEFFRAFRTHMT